PVGGHVAGVVQGGAGGGRHRLGGHAQVAEHAAGGGAVALHAAADGVDHEAVLVHAELAQARVHHRAAAVAGDEEAAALDRRIQAAAGGEHVAAKAHRLRGRTDVHAAGLALRIGRGEVGAAGLEAVAAAVGDVVADLVELAGDCVEAAECDVECHGPSGSLLRGGPGAAAAAQESGDVAGADLADAGDVEHHLALRVQAHAKQAALE